MLLCGSKVKYFFSILDAMKRQRSTEALEFFSLKEIVANYPPKRMQGTMHKDLQLGEKIILLAFHSAVAGEQEP